MKKITALLVSVFFLVFAFGVFAYNVDNYREQGGSRWVVGGSLDVASGGDLDIESGGSLKLAGTALTATATEMNRLYGAAYDITFEISASANSNVARVTVNVTDSSGSNITGKDFPLEIWLSDSQYGVGLTGTTASGAVDCADHPSTGGEVLTALTAKKHVIAVTAHGTGYVVLEITDTSKTTFYVCVKDPVTGEIYVSDQMETGDYGS